LRDIKTEMSVFEFRYMKVSNENQYENVLKM